MMIGEKAADLIKASSTRQTLLTQYNRQHPAQSVCLGVNDGL